jgi:predicted helicase
MSINEILKKYRDEQTSKVDLGTRFEKLMRAYLLTEPIYKDTIKEVWMWKDFFAIDEFGGIDIGIDLVAYTNSGEYWAVQCKCYQEDFNISKGDIDTFLSASGKSFRDRDGKTVSFSQRLFISTTNNWGPNAEVSVHNQTPPVNRITLSKLQEADDYIDWNKLENDIHGENARKSVKELRADQLEAVEKVN